MTIKQMEKDMADMRACHRQEKQKILKRINAKAHEIQELLRDVKDAASLTPPRVHVIDDRIQDAITKLLFIIDEAESNQ